MSVFTHVRATRTVTTPLLAAALCFNLTACQTPGPGSQLAVDASDPCSGERAAFAGSKTYFQDKVVSGALTGAAVGAFGGALTGLAATGNLRGALIGGLAGGALGGAIGGTSAYYNTLSERARDQNELAYAMNQDLTRETQEIDHTAATFGRLRACRFAAARDVKDRARSGMLDRPTALSRIAYLRDHFDQELQIAHEFGLTMARRSQQFQEAANDLRTRPPVNGQGAPIPRAAPRRFRCRRNAPASTTPWPTRKRAARRRSISTTMPA